MPFVTCYFLCTYLLCTCYKYCALLSHVRVSCNPQWGSDLCPVTPPNGVVTSPVSPLCPEWRFITIGAQRSLVFDVPTHQVRQAVRTFCSFHALWSLSLCPRTRDSAFYGQIIYLASVFCLKWIRSRIFSQWSN